MTNALCAALSVQTASLTPGYGYREQELSEAAIRNAGDGFVAQHHVRFSEITGELLDRHQITPVVLTRNLYDTVVSIRDHLERESVVGPLAYLDQHFADLPVETRTRAVVELMAPWYFSFARSWQDCPGATFVTYEAFYADPEAQLVSLCRQLGVDCDAQRAREAIDQARAGFNRFNVGEVGRGNDLSPELIERIRQMADYFPGHEFSHLGVESVVSGPPGVAGRMN